jgi:hypothetical protein
MILNYPQTPAENPEYFAKSQPFIRCKSFHRREYSPNTIALVSLALTRTPPRGKGFTPDSWGVLRTLLS